jgi:hypothetical protein
MPVSWQSDVLVIFDTINQILSAGIAITALSLLLYALTFNLRDRVARSFAFIMACVAIAFAAKAIGSTVGQTDSASFWLHLQWIGIFFIPPSYLQFSDSLLATTGKPSRGKRLWAVRFSYLISFGFLLTLLASLFTGPLVTNAQPAIYLDRTYLTDLFSIYYMVVIGMSWVNFIRSYQRTLTGTTRRRMVYLLLGATAPALGSYPYLLYGSSIATNVPIIFWSAATLSNLLVGGLIVVMAYAVAFFGVPWPDRVVKTRLFKWLMRGPVAASLVLGLTTLVRRAGALFGVPYSALVPVVMVGAILLMEYTITLFSPLWERWLFSGKDREDINLLHSLENHLLTGNDLHQFLEMVVAAVCDRLRTRTAFVAAFNGNGMELVVKSGDTHFLDEPDLQEKLFEAVSQENGPKQVFLWNQYYLVPLLGQENSDPEHLVGILGIFHPDETTYDDEQLAALDVLTQRASLALQDRFLQQRIFHSMQSLNPKVELIQRLRAASRYDENEIFATDEELPQEDLTLWVKDALTHYWGGPKLTESPLLQLHVVQEAIDLHEGNPANGLRAILKKAIENTRPEGDRRFTGEWILYNILEMKFLEGRKVRDIAMRLAMSEADLYRKQRVAIEAVARAIMDMEEQSRQDVVKIHN